MKTKAYGKCFTCKKKNTEVRLYRPYANFYRPKDNFCNEHIPEGWREGYIPLCFDPDGGVWGYTSVPQETCGAFYALPEGSFKALGWFPLYRPGDTELTHWQSQIIMPS